MTQTKAGSVNGTEAEKLPHWDMSVVYPGLESPEFEDGFRSAVAVIDQLQAFFDDNHIEPAPQIAPDALSDADVARFEQVTARINSTMEQVNELGAYISSFVSTDSRDTVAQAKMSQLQMQGVRLAKLGSRLTAWLASLPKDALIARSSVAADHAYALHKAHVEAERLLTPPEEELLAELGPTGGSAWGKLYNNFSSQLDVTVALPGGEKTLPMSATRNLAYHKDRAVRQAAYEAELAAWQVAAVPLAASLNGIKGEVNAVTQRRGWSSPLAVSLFQNNIDQASLDAMLTAARESFPDFRRYLQAKARLLGLEKLAWFDIFAPIGHSSHSWAYSEGMEFIVAQFGAFSDKMRGLAERAFAENWIDAEPRPGKRDGAFCMRLRGEESRILANFKSDFTAVRTLAHELGHAYHNLNLAPRTVTQKATPMTLAETASIFCETIVKNAAIQQVTDDERLLILETSLQGSCQVVVDISCRFLFEEAVFAKRKARELSVDEFCDLMRDAQLQTYGDGLDETQLHPFMWAAKGHYYSTSRSYYNFPYMFGLLFALGLYARYQDDPDSFRTDYDDLLSSTGMFSAAELATRFDIDIKTPDFWRSSLDVIRAEIAAFETVVGERGLGTGD
ncbi:MAG: M3 family oligoendopeptidase [Caldilineaceae bacterium]|nr:M3 family oligoendopeptidase [Caldilineaceae bacterium]